MPLTSAPIESAKINFRFDSVLCKRMYKAKLNAIKCPTRRLLRKAELVLSKIYSNPELS